MIELPIVLRCTKCTNSLDTTGHIVQVPGADGIYTTDIKVDLQGWTIKTEKVKWYEPRAKKELAYCPLCSS